MPVRLSDDENVALRERRLVLDCPSISISRLKPLNASKGADSYSGSGQIASTPSGHFDIRLFQPGLADPALFMERWEIAPGSMIGEEYQFRVEAVDWQGRTWETVGVLPDLDWGPGGAVIRARTRQLALKSDGRSNSALNTLSIVLAHLIRFPANAHVVTDRAVAGEPRQRTMQLSVGRLSAVGIQFEMQRRDEQTVLTAESTTVSFDEPIIDCILDGLTYVTAQECTPVSIEVANGMNQETRIFCVAEGHEATQIQAPVRIDLQHHEMWDLLRAYLAFAMANVGPRSQRLGAAVRTVVATGRANVEIEALTLAVTVESLAADEFAERGLIEPPSKAVLDETRTILESEANMDDAIKRRLLGALSAMNKPRVKDILLALRDRNLIRKDLVTSFNTLRNRSAHGVRLNWAELQGHVDRCADVLTLFYELTFLAINYCGRYQDLSSPRWPDRNFQAELPVGGPQAPRSVA